MRACVRACVSACVRACVCVGGGSECEGGVLGATKGGWWKKAEGEKMV